MEGIPEHGPAIFQVLAFSNHLRPCHQLAQDTTALILLYLAVKFTNMASFLKRYIITGGTKREKG